MINFFSNNFFGQVSWSKDKETEGIGGWNVTRQSNIKALEGKWRISFKTVTTRGLPHKKVQCSCLPIWYSEAI
jgi:hypothetical protein